MKTVPARGSTVRELAEAEALSYAKRRLVHYNSERSSPYSNDPVLAPAASHAFVSQILRNAMLEFAVHRMTLVDWARAGDPVIHEMLVNLILEFKSRGETLPIELAAYDMEITRNSIARRRKAPARKGMSNLLRDLMISDVIAGIQDRFGIAPTRSSTTRHSGCSIVAEALLDVNIPIGEDAVVKIWQKYKSARPLVPGWSLTT